MTAQSRAAFQQQVAIMCKRSSKLVVPIYGVVDDSPDHPVLFIMKLMHQSFHDAYSSEPLPLSGSASIGCCRPPKASNFSSGIPCGIKPANMLISSPETGL
jgi:hypothetical protein